MKLKFATKTFILANAIAILFRTVQIMFLTESGTAFLKEKFIVINVVGTVVVFLALAYMSLNSYYAARQPASVNCSGRAVTVVGAVSGVLYCVCGGAAFVNHEPAYKIIFILSLAAALFSFLFTASSVTYYRFPKVACLFPLAFWIGEFVVSYIYYTKRSLRVRTVYETLALCACVLFFICFGKACSGVSKARSFKLMYPLGFIASSLCFISVAPELIARIFGFSENVSASCTPQTALISGGIFICAVTLNTFKRSNISRSASE